MSHVFLSYAHKDAETARRLYQKLSTAGYPVWFDEESLMVGQRWEDEISRAIQESLGFIALMSDNSVDHRGYIQKELRLALDELAKTPANQVYLFPVRVSDVRPQEPQLSKIQWLDIFPDEIKGLQKLLKALSTIPGLVTVTDEKEQGKETSPDIPKFNSTADLFRIFLERIPSATPQSGAINAFHVTVQTQHMGVKLPDALRQRYPNKVVLVLQHRYKDLACHKDSFSVTLWFSGLETSVTIPYKAITEITEPYAHIRIS